MIELQREQDYYLELAKGYKAIQDKALEKIANKQKCWGEVADNNIDNDKVAALQTALQQNHTQNKN